MDALDYFQIQNLIHRYADLLDRGKVHEVGALFDHADVYMPGEAEPWSRAGQNRMAEIFRQWTRFYPDADGRPRTRHVTTNLIIEEDGANRATAQSYVIVFQSVGEDFPIQPIIGGTYNDKFEKVDGKWLIKDHIVHRWNDMELPWVGPMRDGKTLKDKQDINMTP